MSKPVNHDPYWEKPEIIPYEFNLKITYIKYNSIKIGHICAICGKRPRDWKSQKMSVAFPEKIYIALLMCNKCALKLIRKGVEAK